MLDHAILQSVAEQMMGTSLPSEHVAESPLKPKSGLNAKPDEVVVGGKRFRVTNTGVKRFRMVKFEMGGKGYQAIEQNPEKPSRWGQLAREGHRVVQFREVGSGKYVAVVVDGKVMEYGQS